MSIHIFKYKSRKAHRSHIYMCVCIYTHTCLTVRHIKTPVHIHRDTVWAHILIQSAHISSYQCAYIHKIHMHTSFKIHRFPYTSSQTAQTYKTTFKKKEKQNLSSLYTQICSCTTSHSFVNPYHKKIAKETSWSHLPNSSLPYSYCVAQQNVPVGHFCL